jgi:hypothetical protein
VSSAQRDEQAQVLELEYTTEQVKNGRTIVSETLSVMITSGRFSVNDK